MTLHIPDAVAVLALVLLAHAWAPKLIAPPAVQSGIGWVVNVLAMVALIVLWFR
jgi:hypothetical protein